jgi:hypothetical protein
MKAETRVIVSRITAVKSARSQPTFRRNIFSIFTVEILQYLVNHVWISRLESDV